MVWCLTHYTLSLHPQSSIESEVTLCEVQSEVTEYAFSLLVFVREAEIRLEVEYSVHSSNKNNV